MRILRGGKFVWILLLVALLTGCPRFVYIDLFNNTENELNILASSVEQKVAPGSKVKFKLSSTSFEVQSELGRWKYARNIPHSGEDGPFFDGTLRVQVNSDGTLFALKVSAKPPLESFPVQPAGFPLDAEVIR